MADLATLTALGVSLAGSLAAEGIESLVEGREAQPLPQGPALQPTTEDGEFPDVLGEECRLDELCADEDDW